MKKKMNTAEDVSVESTRWSLIISICVMMMLISGFFGVVGIASADNTYYVAPDGDDSYLGNETHPWRTIQKAANTLITGDTVYIKEGTYNERVIPKNSGAPGNYITYTAYPGHTVTIDGTGVSVGYGGLVHMTDKGYIKFSELRIIQSSWIGIYATKSDHIIIEKNYIYKSQGSGIWAGHSTNIIIDSNEVDESNLSPSEEAISLYSVDTFEIMNNHVHHFHKEGIDAKVGSRNGKIYKNHVHDGGATGGYGGPAIYIDAGWDEGGEDNYEYNIDVYQNVVHDNGGAGIILVTEVETGRLENINVYNNIVYNCNGGGGGIYEAFPGTLKKDLRFINNIFYNNGLYGITCKDEQVENFIIRNNIVSQNSGYQIQVAGAIDKVTVGHNLIDGSTEITGDDAVIGDPKFVNPVEADFHPQDDSPAIDTGSPVDAPSFDFDGNPRPQGAGYDIGAYEFEYGVATGTISGTVTDTTGAPIEGVTVSTNDYSNTTNPTGNYTIINIPIGNYTVTASATGYFPKSQENVEVLENQTTEVNFILTEAPDLIGLWHFDEGSGTTATDSSGNGNNGTLTNMDPATDWIDGKIGKALKFDGTDDYVDCGNNSSLDITDKITIMLWIKPAVAGEGGPNAAPISKAESGIDWSWQLRYNAPGGYMGFQFNGDPEGSTWVSVKQNLSPGEWYHIAGTFDGTDIKCYLNGVGKDTNQISAIKGGSSTLFIGQDGWDDIFNGTIDEVKIYNRALSEEEIKADYEAGLEDITPPETTITSGPDGTIDYNGVSFNWSGSDDVTPTSQLVYSYKLENYDGDWSSWTSNTSKSYNDLPNGNYTFKVKAKDEAGNEDPTPAERSFTVLVDLSPNGSISGTITYTCNETGIAEATVNLTRVTDGTLIASTTTESSGNYTFTDVSSGDYNLTASKIRFWSNSTSVTVNADTSTIINLMLWLKGDLNNDGTSAGIEDVAMMDSAWKDEIPKDFRYDLNNDGTPADIGDRAMMESAWEREIVLM